MPAFNISGLLGDQALVRFAEYPWTHALDIGAGKGWHTNVLRSMGRKVTTLDLGHNPDIKQPYLDALTFCLPIDAIWCCHVLEHQTDPGRFLRKMYRDLPTGGVLAITVPPAKHDIVGGHVTIWNAGLLLYQLILAGFDCSAARVGTYGYNISVIVEKRPAQLPELTYDTGDIERLAPFFPFAARHGFNGQVANIAW